MMDTRFIVLTSLNEDEEAPKDACLIVIEKHQLMKEFADYLERNSMLSVYSVRKVGRFYYSFGTFFDCAVLEVSLKENVQTTDLRITCEQVAIAETYSFLQSKAKILG